MPLRLSVTVLCGRAGLIEHKIPLFRYYFPPPPAQRELHVAQTRAGLALILRVRGHPVWRVQQLPQDTSYDVLFVAQVPLLVVLWFHPHRWAPLLAAVTFIFAAITDWADGYIARRVRGLLACECRLQDR